MFFSRSLRTLSMAGFAAAAALSQHARPAADPVSNDPLEVVTTRPDTVDDPEARTAALRLLQRARPGVAAFGPYVLTVNFTVQGSGQFTGRGNMEETGFPGGLGRRWTAHLGEFSISRILTDGFYDTGWEGPIPMDVHTARETMLGPIRNAAPFLRTAHQTYKGASLTGVLSSAEKVTTPARDWAEVEHCVDSTSGVLRIYSEAPGMYVVYDYDKSTMFHGRLMPNGLTVYKAGKVAMEETISVKDAGPADTSLFQTTPQMIRTGVNMGPLAHMVLKTPTTSASTIVVHAVLSPEGQVTEAVALQDSPLAQDAVDLVKRTKYDPDYVNGRPQQREIFVTVQ
jgi:hypothetical protein